MSKMTSKQYGYRLVNVELGSFARAFIMEQPEKGKIVTSSGYHRML